MLLSFVALRTRSWRLLWLASILSMLFSLLAGLSIGAFVILTTCLQLGATIAMRWEAGGAGWVRLLAVATAVWIAVVVEPF